MPIESYVDAEKRCIFAKVSGDFTIQEIVDTIDQSVRNPQYRPGFCVLSDHTQIGEPLTPLQAGQMVEHMVTLAESLAGCRWAVVTTTQASYGMIRMVSVLAERVPIEVQVFTALEEAESWLGLS